MNYYNYEHSDAITFYHHLHKGIDAIIDHITALHKVMLPILGNYHNDLEDHALKLMGVKNDCEIDSVLNDMLTQVEDSPYVLQASPFPLTDTNDSYPLMVNTVMAGNKRQYVFLMVPYPTLYVAGALVKEKIMTLTLAYRRSLTLKTLFAAIGKPDDLHPSPTAVSVSDSDISAYRACMRHVDDRSYFSLLNGKKDAP